MEEMTEFKLTGIVSLPEGKEMANFFSDFVGWIESQDGIFEGSIEVLEEAEPDQ